MTRAVASASRGAATLALCLLVTSACASSHVTPPHPSSRPAARPSQIQSFSAPRMGQKETLGTSAQVRVPAGWAARRAGRGVNSILEMRPSCGHPVITIRGPLATASATALDYANHLIKTRGAARGTAGSPTPAPPLDGTPAVAVTFGADEQEIVAVRSASAYVLAAGGSACGAQPTPAVLDAVAQSWRWIQ